MNAQLAALLVLLLTSGQVAGAAIIPSSTELMAQANCVDKDGVSHSLRVVLYEYDDHPGILKGTLRSEVIAIEEGLREDCSIRRIWQDYRRMYVTDRITHYDAAVVCQNAQSEGHIIVSESLYEKALIGVYRFSLTSTIAEEFPTPAQHDLKCISAGQQPKAMDQLWVDRGEEVCSSSLLSAHPAADQIVLTWRAADRSCSNESLTFNSSKRQFSGLPKKWRTLSLPKIAPVVCVDERASALLQGTPVKDPWKSQGAPLTVKQETAQPASPRVRDNQKPTIDSTPSNSLLKSEAGILRPTQAESIPERTITLAQATCKLPNGDSRAAWLSRRYYKSRAEARDIPAANVFALETGDPLGCPFSRAWQDFRSLPRSEDSWADWKGAITCPSDGQKGYLLLLQEKTVTGLERLVFELFSVDLNASVATFFPSKEMLETRSIHAALKPTPIARIELERPDGDCGIWEIAMDRTKDQLTMELRNPWKTCPPARVAVNLKTLEASAIPKAWKLIAPGLPAKP